MTMSTSKQGKMLITHLEGVCLSKYLDSVGVWTIGIGATRTEIPDLSSWPVSKTWTMKEAFEMLDKSLVKYENAVNRAIKITLKQHQFDALVSICYNIGTGGLAKSTFVKRINANMGDAAIAQAIAMWDKPKEIIGRRKKEATLYTSGNYGSTKALLFKVRTPSYTPDYKNGKEINLTDFI